MRNKTSMNPLETAMMAQSLKNADLVKASLEQLTFKQVQKARKGRRVTANIQGKIVRALNACLTGKRYTVEDLFYDKGGRNGTPDD